MSNLIRINLPYVLLLAALGTGCGGGVSSSPAGGDDDDGDATYTLSDGIYTYTLSEVPADTCWAPPKENPDVPMTIEAEVTSAGNTVTMSASSDLGDFHLELARDGNQLLGGSSDVLDLNESYGLDCVLQIDSQLEGTITGDDRFDATHTIDLAQQSGNDCAAFLVGNLDPNQLDQLPCSVTLAGDVVKNAI